MTEVLFSRYIHVECFNTLNFISIYMAFSPQITLYLEKLFCKFFFDVFDKYTFSKGWPPIEWRFLRQFYASTKSASLLPPKRSSIRPSKSSIAPIWKISSANGGSFIRKAVLLIPSPDVKGRWGGNRLFHPLDNLMLWAEGGSGSDVDSTFIFFYFHKNKYLLTDVFADVDKLET